MSATDYTIANDPCPTARTNDGRIVLRCPSRFGAAYAEIDGRPIINVYGSWEFVDYTCEVNGVSLGPVDDRDAAVLKELITVMHHRYDANAS